MTSREISSSSDSDVVQSPGRDGVRGQGRFNRLYAHISVKFPTLRPKKADDNENRERKSIRIFPFKTEPPLRSTQNVERYFVLMNMTNIPRKHVEMTENNLGEMSLCDGRFLVEDPYHQPDFADSSQKSILLVREKKQNKPTCVSKSFKIDSGKKPGDKALQGLSEISIHKYVYSLAKEQSETSSERPLSEYLVAFIEGFACVHLNVSKMYLVMEYCSLGDVMKPSRDKKTYAMFSRPEDFKYGGFDREMAREIMAQVTTAVKFLHEEAGVAHRDIKPDNIYVSGYAEDAKKIKVKLGDFGISATMDPSGLVPSKNLGTVGFIPLQVFENEKYYGARGDIFSLGVTYVILLTGKRLMDLRDAVDMFDEQKRYLMDNNCRDPTKYKRTLLLPNEISGTIQTNKRRLGTLRKSFLSLVNPFEYEIISEMLYVENDRRRPTASYVLGKLMDVNK